ncbi:hypothetical protein LAZ67_4001487 [Cordylochernes scorpioides]|uniref:Uncharacterized protein n=1 Tax=Cordylochernes scorpioides TaxID=51811 RepID=A0ABY6KC67_9ARAC|nr:hypothetical protein LAZ67_4001487 [Cordylochernes scorpioides]
MLDHNHTPVISQGILLQLENMKQRRIKRTRYERLPNVTPISSDFEEDLALRIRRIVQEELQKFMPKMTEVEPFGTSDVNSLEAIVKEEVQQTRRFWPQRITISRQRKDAKTKKPIARGRSFVKPLTPTPK